jgi:hypothetical protein
MSGMIIAQSETKRATQAAWSHTMQRRVMRLLSHLDDTLFQRQFRTFYAQSTHPHIPFLQFYDRYLRLLLLSEELLDDIMLRVQTQLSLQTDQIELLEDAPTRGEIDWPRTLQRNFNELPDGTPLLFDTTIRKQSTATPENIFVIAVLQAYHQELQEVLTEDLKSGLFISQERQQLTVLDERLERLLSNPQIRSLMTNIAHVDIEQLAAQVMAQLHPGISAYRDLVTWWEQFQTLHVGSISGQRHLTFTSKRQDAESDQWLYELWIALEFIQLLLDEQALQQETLVIEIDYLCFHFTWQQHHFVFKYRRQGDVDTPPVPGWPTLSSVTATYTIEHERPFTIHNGETLVWQEPPLPLRAVYAASRTTEQCEQTRQAAIQRLLGEMHVLGSPYGMVLAANLAELPSSTQELARDVTGDTQIYLANHDTLGRISEYQLLPTDPLELLQKKFHALLPQMIAYLPDRETPACHGILIDVDSINVSRDRLVRGNVLCPKPHIGQGVVDIVDMHKHCLKDPRLCHVYGQQIPLPFVIRASTLEDMNEQGSNVRRQNDQTLSQAEASENEARVEQLISTIFLGVGRSVERYVKMQGNTSTIEAYYEDWIFGDYWKKHPRCLSVETRNILLSAAYVWDEYKHTPELTDWAAPAVQYCRALETEVKRRIFDHYPSFKPDGFKTPGGHMTLGALATISKNKDRDVSQANYPKERYKIEDSQYNWQLLTKLVTASKSSVADFDNALWYFTDDGVADKRNLLAHGSVISQSIAQSLRDGIIGNKGALGFLTWLVENLDPK